jgi:hypothetical protein
MYIRCYESTAEADVKEQLWLLSEYMSASSGGAVRFYILDNKLTWALIVDPAMRHIHSEDLIL